MVDEKRAGVGNRRVYSYVSDDGTVYWSLTKAKKTVSNGQRLVLQSRNGSPLLPFMSYMRDQAALMDKEASTEVNDDTQLENNKQTKGN